MTAPPPFRLETVLDVRRHERDVARRKLADGLRHADHLARRQESLHAERRQQLDEMQALLKNPKVDVDAVIRRRTAASQLLAELRQVEWERRTFAKQLERLRAALIEADQKVHALEKLRARRERAWQHHALQVEQRELEEAWQGIRQASESP